jgi:hypothetical protein
VGCGRGAVLMLAARQVPGDRAATAGLREAGCTGVAVRQLDWRTWYGLLGHHIPLAAAARPPG